ncbi:TPA: hypothetical protein JBL19_15375 [Legionella pneumophila]|nr:hypothetical protein [Legionella pneumophila]HAT1884311.1 hypothetical protein [Legionella pneumophila]HAT1903828.1 hypothetical protein [Legionella pneumophila]HAT2115899.1 hypothetical protein [Legionella pneumophila]HAT3890694.1 hypothetical protein [Legionella pneumophila]
MPCKKEHPLIESLKGLQKRGKSSMGCFLGFELHLVINDYGELMAFKLTGATVDDHISKLSVS